MHSLVVHSEKPAHVFSLDCEVLVRVITMSLSLGRQCVQVRLTSLLISDSDKTTQCIHDF